MSKNLDHLLYNVQKKFQTTMIGALARFEETFGYLWEKEHKDRELFEQKWEDTRNSILNNGNKQLRSALNEISDFLEDKQLRPKYHYKFYFNKNERGDNNYEN